ncbi:MAG: DNA polymerase IV [Eubacteriales bacterium]
MQSIIFHIDVNSAFLSWSAVENLKNGSELDLRTIPSIIGGDQETRHGVVLAKSIPAKKYGIRTGEPVADAFRKCPHLVTQRPCHNMYKQYSEKMMEYLRTYTPDIEQVSVDECYLDFTGIAHLYESPLDCAMQIKDGIDQKLGFTVNIGISTSKVLAKMASDFQKPNKIHTLYLDEIEAKMWPMPVGELYMAGKASVKTMEKLEIKTIGDLAGFDRTILRTHLKSHGDLLWNYANGIDESTVGVVEPKLKGIGNSTTISNDLTTMEESRKVLLELAESVGGRLRSSSQKANMVSVEIKYNTFQSVSHQCQLQQPSNANDTIYQTACKLFEELWTGEPVRLLGIRTAKLQGEQEPEQMNLFDLDFKRRRLDEALDRIKEKYGDDAVHRGSLMRKQDTNVEVQSTEE